MHAVCLACAAGDGVQEPKQTEDKKGWGYGRPETAGTEGLTVPNSYRIESKIETILLSLVQFFSAPPLGGRFACCKLVHML